MSEDNVSVGGAERASESDSRHPADGDPYTTAHTPTNKQRDILRHALGFGRRTRPGWRNHFVTSRGSDDYDDCEALVAAGLMTKREGSALSGWDAVYTVTAEGKAVARSKTLNAGGKPRCEATSA